MKTPHAHLSDKALLATLQQTCFDAHRLLGKLILLLIEVDERRLHLVEGHSSLFEFCRKELRMSEGEAYRRINAARLVQRFPKLLARIACGDIHLTALAQLRHHFNDANVDHLVDAAKGRNKAQLAELVARLAPREGKSSKIRKIPQYDESTRMTRRAKSAVDAISEALYRLQVTSDRAFRDKILRARDLMMESNPNGDLAVVVERALDRLLEVLEEQRHQKPGAKGAEASLVPVTPTDAPLPPTARPAAGARSGNKKRSREPRPGLARVTARRRAQNHGRGETDVAFVALDDSRARLRQTKQAAGTKPERRPRRAPSAT